MAQMRIFVSHSKDDNAVTRRLVDDLRAAGASVWVDLDDMGAGNWVQSLDDALSNFDWFLLVLTDAALASKWVMHEVSVAISMKNAGEIQELLFIKAGPLNPKNLPKLWGISQRFDATQDYDNALARTRTALGLGGNSSVPTTSIPNATASVLLSASETGAALGGDALEGSDGMRLEAKVAFTATAQPAESVDDLVEAGEELWHVKRYEQAIAVLERAAAINPQNRAVQENLAMAYDGASRLDDAVQACDRWAALAPGDPMPFYNKAIALSRAGEFEDALVASDQALANSKDDPDLWRQQAGILHELGWLDEALDAYNQILRFAPANEFALRGKAAVLHEMGRVDEAEQAQHEAKVVHDEAWAKFRKLGNTAL